MSDTKPVWFDLTDHGNARAFAHHFANQLKFCPENQNWLHWSGVVWEFGGEAAARQLFVESLHRRKAAYWERSADTEEETSRKRVLGYLLASENNAKTVAALTCARSLPEFMVRISDFDKDLMRLTVANGEVDLRTGKFEPAKAEHLATCHTPVEFVEGAECPMWESALRAIFRDDQQLLNFFQKCVGYSLTGDVSEQVMFVCVGEGANGKSTVLEVVKALLGGYGASTPFLTFDAKSKNEQTNDLARLKGKRFVSIVETDEDSYLAEAKVKLATGGEALTCRYLHKEFFEYTPQYKIWMATNRAPQIKGTDHGIRRRLLLIPFNKRFEGSERVAGLKELLLKELPGILNWALRGLAMWQREGLRANLPDAILNATEEYKEENDMIDSWMLERVEKAPENVRIRATEFYTSYAEYMKLSGVRPKGIVTWGKDMKSRGVQKVRDAKGYCYVGVKLAEGVI